MAPWTSLPASLELWMPSSLLASCATTFLDALSSSISLMSFFSSCRLMDTVSCFVRSWFILFSMSSILVYLMPPLAALASLMRESVTALSSSRRSKMALRSFMMAIFLLFSLLNSVRAAPRGEFFAPLLRSLIFLAAASRAASATLICSFNFSMSLSCFSFEGRSTRGNGLLKSTSTSSTVSGSAAWLLSFSSAIFGWCAGGK
mmetsp:Transcript_18151/g.33739  ORF Transcript_18151/g.33739 Transcript_18151/m.33739 type:complete len:203 (+) Transcript_18151:1133-1741(+)